MDSHETFTLIKIGIVSPALTYILITGFTAHEKGPEEPEIQKAPIVSPVTEQFTTGENTSSLAGENNEDTLCLETGDFDGDGDIDYLVAMTGAGRSGIYGQVNDAGNQYHRTPLLIGYNSESGEDGLAIASGDMDEDGDLDLLVAKANEHFSAIRFYENRGNWEFVYAGDIARLPRETSEDGIDIEVADMDGDGDLDVLAGKSVPEMSGVTIFYDEGTSETNVRTPSGDYTPGDDPPLY